MPSIVNSKINYQRSHDFKVLLMAFSAGGHQNQTQTEELTQLFILRYLM